MPHEDQKQCSNCNHWKPRYYQIGQCTAEGMPNAKFWVAEQKDLLTAASFYCQSFQQKQSPSSEII